MNRTDAGLAFITAAGLPWVRAHEHQRPDGTFHMTFCDAVGQTFAKLLRARGLKHSSANFYALRHTFRTVADKLRDVPAVDLVMGHAHKDSDTSKRYVEEITDDRLEAVADHVREWLMAADPLPETSIPKPLKRASRKTTTK